MVVHNKAYDLQVAWIFGPVQKNLLGSGVRVLHDALTSAGVTHLYARDRSEGILFFGGLLPPAPDRIGTRSDCGRVGLPPEMRSQTIHLCTRST
jgi:hypothetical protein